MIKAEINLDLELYWTVLYYRKNMTVPIKISLSFKFSTIYVCVEQKYWYLKRRQNIICSSYLIGIRVSAEFQTPGTKLRSENQIMNRDYS